MVQGLLALAAIVVMLGTTGHWFFVNDGLTAPQALKHYFVWYAIGAIAASISLLQNADKEEAKK